VPLIVRAVTVKEGKTTARLLQLTGENADTVTDLAARNAASVMAREEFSGPRLKAVLSARSNRPKQAAA
jgi:hypothetical protein